MEFRIVEWYCVFFAKWCYALEKKTYWRSWFFGWHYYEAWNNAGSAHGDSRDADQWKKLYTAEIIEIRDHKANENIYHSRKKITKQEYLNLKKCQN